MKFKIEFSNNYYFNKSAKKFFEELFNIKFIKSFKKDMYQIDNENSYIEIKDFNELLELGKKIRRYYLDKIRDSEDIFVVRYNKEKDEWVLEVYNSYRE